MTVTTVTSPLVAGTQSEPFVGLVMGPNGVKRCLLTQDVVSFEWGFIEYYQNENRSNMTNT